MRVEKKYKAFAYRIYRHFTQQCGHHQLDELCAINQLFDGDDETRKMRLSNCSEKRPRPLEQTQFTNFMIKTQGCQCTNSSSIFWKSLVGILEASKT